MSISQTPRIRDAQRSQDTILEASTLLFAKQGFEATTMQQIAEAAGVARGTPSYFFSTKEKLFQAVLEKESQQAKLVVPNALEQSGKQADAKTLIFMLVDTYLDFLDSHPRYLRLLQWTALERPGLMKDVESHWQTIVQANEAASMVWPTQNPNDTKHLALSIIGMCTFHFFFGDVISQHLDIDPKTKGFLQERKNHLKQFLLATLNGIPQ